MTFFSDIAKAIRATASALEWWCRTAKMREIRATRKTIKDLEDDIENAKNMRTPDGAELSIRLLDDLKFEKEHLEYLSNADN